MTTSPYDSHPGFYQDDHRLSRPLSPISKEQLENKHAAMFAEWNLEGKSVLDLGSCLGAAGQWVLSKGSTKYVGVEAQAAFANKSKALLAHHGDKVKIVQSSIDDFLQTNTEKYDVVVMLGVIYGFLNQYEILQKVATICSEVLIVEGIYPHPHVGDYKAPIIEISAKQTMVYADQEQSIFGVGARITPAALEILMSTLGFETIGQTVKPKQIKGSIDNYSGDPSKYYLVRYICTFKNSGTINKKLSDIFNNADYKKAEKANWTEANGKLKYVDPKLPTLAEKQWVFDEKVALEFQKEAQTNIPDYDRVIDRCLQIASQLFKKDAKIIDVGSALGETLRRFHEQGFKNLYGVDNSPNMIKHAFQTKSGKVTYVCSNKFPKDQRPFDMITANWVLHFIKERKKYLQNIYDSLSTGGCLVLSDKVLQSQTVADLYKNFKREKGLTEDYIAYKEEAIKEILIPYPLEWYLVTLRELGFRSIEIINANYAFVTFYAVK